MTHKNKVIMAYIVLYAIIGFLLFNCTPEETNCECIKTTWVVDNSIEESPYRISHIEIMPCQQNEYTKINDDIFYTVSCK